MPVKKSKRKKPSAKSAPPVAALPGRLEDRTVLALTVAWMLTGLCSLAAELSLLAALAIARPSPAEGGSASATPLAASALLLAGVVTGALCLALTPVVWRLRQVKPPWPIVAGAVLAGSAPLVTLGFLSWLT